MDEQKTVEGSGRGTVGRPGTFGAGNSVAAGRGPAEAKASQLLRDMRGVYKNGKASDRTEARRKLRQFFNDDPKGFVAQMAKLEEAERGLKADAVAASVVDEGEARVLELIDRLLKGYKDGDG